jgi:hypothetical protein
VGAVAAAKQQSSDRADEADGAMSLLVARYDELLQQHEQLRQRLEAAEAGKAGAVAGLEQEAIRRKEAAQQGENQGTITALPFVACWAWAMRTYTLHVCRCTQAGLA